MASAKKKLDEYHLKVLRQIVTQPVNKQCFDCNQRGPTYVNVTIGSFVCTTCSGMLRGLTPPHRVKSISMATFTPEEVDFIKARGNEYCRRIWLGLCDSQQPTKDEQQIKDFMISKYERKRYYLDPAPTLNGNASNGSVSPISKPSTPSVQLKIQYSSSSKTLPTPAIIPPNSLAFKAAPTPQVNNINAFTPEPSFNADFSNLANTTPSDPFSSASQFATTPSTQQSFANFDNNPIFNNSSAPEVDDFSDMIQSSSSSLPQMLFPMLNVPMRAMSAKSNRVPTNRWSIAGIGETGSVPGEDRYAALKDLDSLMKSQQQQTVETQPPAPDWNNGVSNVWQAPSAFNPLAQSVDNNITSNPFKGENAWTNGNSLGANPFRNSRPVTEVLWPVVANGQIPNGFPTSQSLNFAPSKLPWNSEAVSNPFVLGNTQQQTTGHHSSNPFL